MKIQKFTYLLGFLGPIIIIIGSLITAIGYTGKVSEHYSLLNHFVSELGEVGVSEWAVVFNISLFIGGLCITGFMLGVATLFNNIWGTVFGVLGLGTGLSGSLVGFFPMNNLQPHIMVAMWFFRAGLVSSAFFAVYVFLSKQKVFSRWTSIPAASISVITFIFLYILKPVSNGDNPLAFAIDRPVFMPNALVEWAILIAIMAWVLVSSFDLYSHSKAGVSNNQQTFM